MINPDYTFAMISGCFYLFLYINLFLGSKNIFSVETTDNHLDAIKAMTLTAPLGVIYLFAANFKYRSLIDLANLWRYFWLFPCCFFNLAGPHPLSWSSHILRAEILFVPCFFLFCDSDIIKVFTRLQTHYSATTTFTSQIILSCIGYFGFVFFMVLLSYRERNLETFYITIISGYYIFFDWFAKSRDINIIMFSIPFQSFPALYLLINWISNNFIHDMEIDYMVAYSTISTLLYLYSLGFEYFNAMANCGAWAFRCAVINLLVSVIWVIVSPLFDPHPQKIALTQHRFDLMLSLFVILIGCLMDKIKERAFHSATYVTFFIPFQLLWYLTEIKLVIFFNFGSPYHPSWVAKGFVKGYHSYHQVIDVTNGLSTVLMTAVATFSGAIIVLQNIELKGWDILSINGVMLVSFSAIYMMAAVSGFFPKMVSTGYLSYLEIKPVIPLPQHHLVDAINIHVRDNILGIMCIMTGLGFNNRKASDNLKTNASTIWTIVTITWVLFMLPKLSLHLAGYPFI